ncbi:MAG: tetratricopeptide repeat protein, partial [Burkholderiales bacterium]|nr:tetratricopeptide repeat protein [Burkholderiales bacterium]
MAKLSASKVTSVLKQAAASEASGNLDVAKSLYMQVLESFPARQDANKGLLDILFRTNQWTQAEQQASK